MTKVDEKNWLEKAKDGWRAMREKKREKREEIEKMIADASGSGAKEEEEEEEDEDEDEKENDLCDDGVEKEC